MGSRSIQAQWTNTAIFAATALLWFVVSRGDGFARSLVIPGILLGIALASSPLLKRSSVSQDTALASGNSVVIYHRPGCSYCIRMKALLGPAGQKATWVDIWEDESAAEFVRSVNDGNETVPTVVIDGKSHTNPAPSFVRESLAG